MRRIPDAGIAIARMAPVHIGFESCSESVIFPCYQRFLAGDYFGSAYSDIT
jgi:hypothetical protein